MHNNIKPSELPKVEISIIIVNYNAFKLTLALIENIARLKLVKTEVFLIDNNSDYFEKNRLLDLLPTLEIIESQTNLGFAGANNLAIKHVNGELLIFLNNDTIITKELIYGISKLSKINNFGGLSPIIKSMPNDYTHPPIQYAGSTKINAFTGRNKIIQTSHPASTQLTLTENLHGACMAIPTQIYIEVGMMDSTYFLYYEEVDLSSKIKAAGYDLYVANKLEVLHHGSPSIGHNSLNQLYYLQRGRVIYMKRWGSPVFYLWLLLLMILKPIGYLNQGQFQKAKTYLKACFAGLIA